VIPLSGTHCCLELKKVFSYRCQVGEWKMANWPV
jgi:hypothetical protein